MNLQLLVFTAYNKLKSQFCMLIIHAKAKVANICSSSTMRQLDVVVYMTDIYG